MSRLSAHFLARASRRPLIRLVTLAIVLALAPLALGTSPGQADPGGDDASLTKRFVPDKPDHAKVGKGYSHDTLNLKFKEGADFRLRGTRLVSSNAEDEDEVADALARFHGLRVERLFSRAEAALAREKARIEAKSGREQADKNLYYRLRLPKNVDAVEVVDALNALDVVEIAYAEPLPMPAPVTPDFEPNQNYRNPATDGIDADYARTIPGGRGSNVRIIDIEYSWNRNHEDLTKAAAAGALVSNGTPSDPFSNNDHGTAVLGEMIADDNGSGVTGLADQAAIGLTNANNTADGYDLADSIDTAHAALNDGDVILLEQQIAGPNGCNNGTSGCVPVEWVQAFYDAIVSATSDGIIVVEAAGNGNENLDVTATYGSPFPSGRADSGAIIVGSAENCAGNTQHNRVASSTFGARVNLHSYGECVTTSGYGGLQGSSMTNDAYTGGFSGTSSASPMVTSAAAILSSVAQQQGDANGLTSTEARSMLAAGATPQATGTGTRAGPIGPMPDLGDALAPWVPVADAGGDYTTPEGIDVGLSASGSSDPQGSALTYEWDLDNDGAFDDATGATPTYTLVGQDGAFPVRVKVTDAQGASDIDTAAVNVTNVAPTVFDLANDAPVDEGAALSQQGTVGDPGWLEALTGTIGWGDATTSNASGTLENDRPDATLMFANLHAYGDNGSYPIQVCGLDDDTSTCANTSAQVDNVAPTVSADPLHDLAIDEGDTFSTTATFSDPGWLDTYTATVDWGTGDGPQPATPVITHQGDPTRSPDQGSVSGSHTYGDNGVYTVTIRVTDDDGGPGMTTFDVTVGNVDPTTAINLGGTVDVNGNPTVVAEAGQTVAFSGRSTDPGSDDVAISWDWDDGLPSPDVTTTYLVNPPATDPPLSPTVQPRDVTDTKNHAFGAACMYLVTLSARDDDAGTSSDDVNVIITGNETRRFGAGYWYNQYRTAKGKIAIARLNCYLEIADYASDVFNEKVDASTRPKATLVLGGSGPAPPPQLHRELLAAWLNFANGAISLDELVDTDRNGVKDTAFYDVLLAAEAVSLDPGATSAEILAQKNLLERINLGRA